MIYKAVIKDDGLYHSGKKGQKWYHRRWQNEDGTYTEAGKARRREEYRSEHTIDGTYRDVTNEQAKTNRQRVKEMSDDELIKANKRDAAESQYLKNHPDINTRTQRLNSAKDIANATTTATNAARTGVDAIKNRVSGRKNMDLSKMSNKELQDAITRTNLERQYVNTLPPTKVEKGFDTAKTVLAVIGAVSAVAASGVGIAVGISDLAEKRSK